MTGGKRDNPESHDSESGSDSDNESPYAPVLHSLQPVIPRTWVQARDLGTPPKREEVSRIGFFPDDDVPAKRPTESMKAPRADLLKPAALPARTRPAEKSPRPSAPVAEDVASARRAAARKGAETKRRKMEAADEPAPTTPDAPVAESAEFDAELANAIAFVALNWTDVEMQDVRAAYRSHVRQIRENVEMWKGIPVDIPSPTAIARVRVPSLDEPVAQFKAWSDAKFAGPEPSCANWEMLRDQIRGMGPILFFMKYRKPFPPAWGSLRPADDKSDISSQLDNLLERK